MFKSILAASSVALAAGSMAMAVPASAATVHQIGSCTARGDFATCVASGNARHHPLKIVLHVRATPTQSVSGSWSMVCTKGTGAGSKSGNYHGGTPINRALPKPYRHPDSCTVAADGQLKRHGKIHVWLTYTN